jgi:hypothetical protein
MFIFFEKSNGSVSRNQDNKMLSRISLCVLLISEASSFLGPKLRFTPRLVASLPSEGNDLPDSRAAFDVVEEALRRAQLESESMPSDPIDKLQWTKQEVETLFQDGIDKIERAGELAKREAEENQRALDEERAKRYDALTNDLLGKIDSMTSDLKASSPTFPASKSTGDPAIDRALAAAEAKIRQAASLSLPKVPLCTKCVLVSPPSSKSLQVGASVAAQLTAKGWEVIPLVLDLGRSAGIQPSPEAAAACAEGAVVVICPELETEKKGLFGMPSECLAPVDATSLQRLLKAMAGCRHVVMVSVAGVQRIGQFPYVFGGLDQRLAAENAVSFLAKQQGFAYSFIRVGGLVEAAVGGAVVAPGDSLSLPASKALVADAIVQVRGTPQTALTRSERLGKVDA